LRFIDVATLWYGVKIMKAKIILLITLALLAGTVCTAKENPPVPTSTPSVQKQPLKRKPGCTGCHTEIKADKNHNLACSDCHLGNNAATRKETAHKNMLASPAAPGNMKKICGRCHKEQVTDCAQSLHFTLKNEVNAVRAHFSLTPPLSDLRQIPETEKQNSKEWLVNDLLRRQCLRCHVYTAGDSYPYVQRGIGCAACHLQFTDGQLKDHVFRRPTEHQCLSCHYGNHVGSDYSGKFEHDFNWEYRTPYTTRSRYLRPYGVELHNLVPDIHSQKGLTCLDCHNGRQLSGKEKPIQCISCHTADITSPLPANVNKEDNDFFLTTIKDGSRHRIPQLVHPAHTRYRGRVACQVCHAQWGFYDRPTHLMLSYLEDADPWERLTIQSSSAAEAFLEHNLNSDDDELSPFMPDAINGKQKPGIWLMGFTQRRWKDIIIKKDNDGIIKVFRPILDLRLSAISEDEDVLFDNLQGKGNSLLPYTPHTTGPAGLFYEQRFIHLLEKKQPQPISGQ